jgi:hypothetical protein
MKDYIQSHLIAILASYAAALLAASWFLFKRLPELIRSMRAASWPLSQGRIETVDVKTFRDQALAELGYSYVVEGERYSGYYSRQFADEQHGWDFVDALQGKQIAVRYQEDDPSVSALRAADQQSYIDLRGPGFIGSLYRAAFERLREFYPRRL